MAQVEILQYYCKAVFNLKRAEGDGWDFRPLCENLPWHCFPEYSPSLGYERGFLYVRKIPPLRKLYRSAGHCRKIVAVNSTYIKYIIDENQVQNLLKLLAVEVQKHFFFFLPDLRALLAMV